MSLQSLRVQTGELIATLVQKYNQLVNKVIFNVDVDGKNMRFFTNNGVYVVTMPIPDIPPPVADDTDYASNVFINDGDKYNKVISDLDAVLGAIAPAKSGTLNGVTLEPVNTVFYTAKLSAGMVDEWYTGGLVPGDTLTRYVVNPNYILKTPDNTFHVGFKNLPIGRVAHLINNADYVYTNIGNSPTTNTLVAAKGTSTLNINSYNYERIWQRGRAEINFNHTTQGNLRHSLKQVNQQQVKVGETNAYEIWYDDNNYTPVFLSMTYTETSPVFKYLSGISYYAQGSIVTINYTISNLFRYCYHPTNVTTIASDFFPSTVVNPSTPPVYTSNYVVTKQVTLTIGNASSGVLNGLVTVTANRPDGNAVSQSIRLNKRVCTYGTVSTPTQDFFYDEAQRLNNGTNTPFNSTAVLENGYAQVTNGVLVYGNVDYASKTGIQTYERYAVKVSANSGTLTISGVEHSKITPYGTGDLNVLLRLEGSAKYYDLGLPNGAGGNGTTQAAAIGCKKAAESGGSMSAFTFGLASTALAGNNNQYRIIVSFRDTAGAKVLNISNIIAS